MYVNNSDNIKSLAAIYRDKNRDIINKKAAIYNSKDQVKKKQSIWRKENKQHLREKEKAWKLANPEKYKQISKIKQNKQRQKPLFKLKAHVSRQVNFALHAIGNSKCGQSVMKFLPYTIKDLKYHLEKQFESWMNWENYGIYSSKSWDDDNQLTWRWQIDHIIPQSNFPYTSMEDENFCKCCSLENLRPYSAKKNCIDGVTRTRHK